MLIFKIGAYMSTIEAQVLFRSVVLNHYLCKKDNIDISKHYEIQRSPLVPATCVKLPPTAVKWHSLATLNHRTDMLRAIGGGS